MIIFVILIVVISIVLLQKNMEGFQCCKDCMGEKECYAYCSPDVVSPCGRISNDPITCAKCSFCIWIDGPGIDGGRCVSREEYYLGSPTFSWPGYAPQYMNIYFAN